MIFAALAAWLLVAAASTAFANQPTDTPADPPVSKKQLEDAVKDAAKTGQTSGDVAWMLVSTGLVFVMVPGLALFYGGMARRKNVLGTMMQSMVALGIVGIQWVLIGYCLAFGKSQGGWIGWSPELLGLQDIVSQDDKTGAWQHKVFSSTNLPILLHCMYQGMFAIITPALISGALAERIKFGPYCLFVLLWSTLIYAPLAHWVWAVNDAGTAVGWLGAPDKVGAIDFAGGTVVHIAAGFSALAAILVLRKRFGYPEHAMHPNSMVLTLTGAGLLWFGWFGFNGGSALASNGLAAAALGASQIAAAAAALSWMIAEWFYKGKPTALGFASGLVAGLVAITPASGFVLPWQAFIIGALAGLVCYAMVCLKPFFKYDDSLDAFGVHGIGGLLGALLTGVFANLIYWQAGAGVSDRLGKLVSGDERMAQIVAQIQAAAVSAAFAFIGTAVLVKLIDLCCGGFCLDAREENEGLDRVAHGEAGFDFGPAIDGVPEFTIPEPRAAMVPAGGQDRFTVLVEGAEDDKLIHVWSSLCQTGPTPPEPEFLAVYPFVTTVQGNRFRFRGGEPVKMRESLQKLFQKHLGTSVRTSVDGNGRKTNNGHARVPIVN
ncbi:MAG TPA: ammonium transporter [Gemmataceae bacterium]|nr:ammonium transporter [Gemmataceae bacterium]